MVTRDDVEYVQSVGAPAVRRARRDGQYRNLKMTHQIARPENARPTESFRMHVGLSIFLIQQQRHIPTFLLVSNSGLNHGPISHRFWVFFVSFFSEAFAGPTDSPHSGADVDN